MKKLSWVFLMQLLVGTAALAAQVGTIIVDEAQVHQFPQGGSNVITTLPRDQSLAVSNIPTEGFYKVRLPSGELGWISGNDMLVGKKPAAPASAEPVTASAPEAGVADPAVAVKPAARKKKKKEAPIPEVEEDAFDGDDSRILLMLGVQNPSYADFKESYVTEGLLPNSGVLLEMQFKLSKHFHWAARAEFNFAKVDAKEIATDKTQTLKQSSIPLMAGIVFSPVTTRGFRLGVGAYAGMALASTMTVAQTTPTLSEQVQYSSVDPLGLINAQMAFGIGTHTAIVVEGGYRYQKTGTLSASSRFGGVRALTIDYSGMVAHAGLEFKF